MNTKIDPILLSVYARTFKSITDEMSISMEQTTRSPILCEAKDYVTGLYDGDGNMLEQTENLPILAFSLAPVCKYIKEYFGDEIYPGDVIFHNDVFSLGNQNNDVAAFKPVFFEDKLVAWTAVKGHQADIGGNVAGGYNPNAVEVWQEALRIPPVKVVERGKLRKDVWNLIFANVRLDIVQHDMKAEMGACTVGERRLLELLKKYGVASYESHKQALFEATRKMMEAEIAKIPNGKYSGEGYVYYDGRFVGSLPLPNEAAQDLATASDGRVAVLDRLGDPSLTLFDAAGRPARTVPLVGGPISEGGAVTGLFAASDGLYVEREHRELVRLTDARGEPDPSRTTLWGRPGRDGATLLRASIADRPRGMVTVSAAARATGAMDWSRTVTLDGVILHLVLLDGDRHGRVYLGAVAGSELGGAITEPRTLVVRFDRAGVPVATLRLPAPPEADELFRPLAIDDEGHVFALSPGADGLSLVEYTFPD